MFLLRNNQYQTRQIIKSIRNKQLIDSSGGILRCTSNVKHLNTSSNEVPDVFASGGLGTHFGTPPKNARVVICGGGVMGASVAYYLAQAGWASHTVLIEQGK